MIQCIFHATMCLNYSYKKYYFYFRYPQMLLSPLQRPPRQLWVRSDTTVFLTPSCPPQTGSEIKTSVTRSDRRCRRPHDSWWRHLSTWWMAEEAWDLRRRRQHWAEKGTHKLPNMIHVKAVLFQCRARITDIKITLCLRCRTYQL